MTSFVKPTRETLSAFLKMELTPAQTEARLVAPNAGTLAEAAYEPASEVWGMWEGCTPVGLVAFLDLAHPEIELDEGEDPNSLFLWRLFVDQRYQRSGHGRQALEFLLKRAKEMSRPKVYTSCVPHKEGALGFYENFGFKPNGRTYGDEIELGLDVT